MVIVAPSILSCDFARLGDEIASFTGADLIHLDIMDGRFVPNISFGSPVVTALRNLGTPFECHLMVEEPERLLDLLTAGARRVFVHAEATRHLDRTLAEIAARGSAVGVALNPATPATCLKHVLWRLDAVLVMTVNPGFSGQAFLPEMLHKIQDLRDLGFKGRIAVDGGIDREHAAACAKAGATDFVAASAITGADDRGAAVAALKTAAAPFVDARIGWQIDHP